MVATMPGMRTITVRAATKIVSCREAGCAWFERGKDGEDEGAPFHHPAGVECGDHARCPDPNCPCPQRLAWEMDINGRPTGRRGHKVVDTGRPRAHSVDGRPVVPDEWLTRLHEGTEAITHIRTRGL
jgi:hypothetical protein